MSQSLSQSLSNVEPAAVGVLLVHGLTGMPSEMRPVHRFLSKKGYEVRSPLLRGHGGSLEDLVATQWQDWLAGIREEFLDLKKTHQHVFIVGLSLGAMLAAKIASEYGNSVSGLVMISTTLFYDGSSISWTRVFLPLTDICPFLSKYFYWNENPPYGLKDIRLQRRILQAIELAKTNKSNQFGLFKTPVISIRENRLLIRQTKKDAHKIVCPVQMIHSREDTIASPKNAFTFYNLLGSKNKAILLESNSDHVLTVDLCKMRVAKAIHDFIEKSLSYTKLELQDVSTS